jgi:hypothetical protein
MSALEALRVAVATWARARDSAQVTRATLLACERDVLAALAACQTPKAPTDRLGQ